jgi:type VI secretion system protein VasD
MMTLFNKNKQRQDTSMTILKRTSSFNRRSFGLFTFSLALALTGCNSSGSGRMPSALPEKTGAVTVRVTAARNVNPSAEGGAAPIAVSVFLLSGTGRFQQSDYFQLVENTASALGDNLKASDSIMLRPGESKIVTLNMVDEQASVGVVAGYQNIDQARWRASVPVRLNDAVTVSIGRLAVSAGK